MNTKQLKSLAVQISTAQHHLDNLVGQYAAFRLDALQKVQVVKNAGSFTLLFKGRIINARKNSYGRYTVRESGRTLASDYLGGMHDLRFSIAQGEI